MTDIEDNEGASGQPSEPASGAAVRDGNAWKDYGRAVLVFFLTYHALAVCLTLIPEESYLSRELTPYFDSYRKLTGTSQIWNMFTAVSSHHSVRVAVEAADTSGRVTSFGPLLPGLRKYQSPPDYFRYHTLFTRYLVGRYTAYLEPYARRIAAQLESQGPFGTFELVIQTRGIRYLQTIRETDRVTYDGEVRRGPWQVGE